MKTNEGKIYVVTYSDPSENKHQLYDEQVYATCEAHAEQIFNAYIPNMTVESIEFVDNCISQHYGEDKDTKIPEFVLAQNMMFAALDEMAKDNDVEETFAQNVIDLAYHMTTLAWKHAVTESNRKRDK